MIEKWTMGKPIVIALIFIAGLGAGYHLQPEPTDYGPWRPGYCRYTTWCDVYPRDSAESSRTELKPQGWSPFGFVSCNHVCFPDTCPTCNREWGCGFKFKYHPDTLPEEPCSGIEN